MSGSPNSRFSAIAAPMTSARSHAAMAISQRNHKTARRRPREMIATGLRQVTAGGDAEPQRERLQQDRHQVRNHDDAEQRVAVARAAREVRGPVAGIHVADRNQVAGPGEREQLPPEGRGDRNGSVDLRQAHRSGRQPPAQVRRRRRGVRRVESVRANWPRFARAATSWGAPRLTAKHARAARCRLSSAEDRRAAVADMNLI